MYDFSMTNAQTALREEIIAFAKKHLSPDAAQRAKDQFFDRTIWEKCGSIGLPGLTISTDYKGRGLDAVSTVIALEALGYGSKDSGINFSLAAHLLACLIPISLYGTEAQKQRLLPALCDGRLIATNAMTEPSAGSDAFNMTSIAEETSSGFLLNGHKNYCSNAPVADIALTYLPTDPEKGFFGGITAFITEKGKHQYETSKQVEKMGIRTCMLGEIKYIDTEVGTDAILGKKGGGAIIFNHSMEWERICLGALHLGAMERMLEDAIAFAKARKSGGKSISHYQAVSHPLVNLKARIESSRLLALRAAWKLDNRKPVGYDAALVKLQVSETYRDFAVQMMQLFAGNAFRENHEAESLLRDAMAATIYSGSSEVLRNIIARHLRLN